MNETRGKYAFDEFQYDQSTTSRKIEFPILRRDDTPMLKEVEYNASTADLYAGDEIREASHRSKTE